MKTKNEQAEYVRGLYWSTRAGKFGGQKSRMRHRRKTACQPYDKNGDSKVKRWRTESFVLGVLPRIKQYLRGNILDVGCGNGRLSHVMSDFANKVHGIDPYEIQIDKFKNNKITYEAVSLEEFSAQKKFDCIFFWGVFYLLHDPIHTFTKYYPPVKEYQDLMLKKCKEMLTDNGVIIISDERMRITHTDEDGWGSYNPKALCEKAGLKLTRVILDEKYTGQLTSVISNRPCS